MVDEESVCVSILCRTLLPVLTRLLNVALIVTMLTSVSVDAEDATGPASLAVSRGTRLLREGDHEAARRELEAAWRAGDQSTETRRLLIECLMADGQLGIAEIEVHNLLGEHPRDAAAYVTLARIALKRGEASAALDAATKAVDLDERMAEALYVRAYAEALLTHDQLALNDVNDSIAAGPLEFAPVETQQLLKARLLQRLGKLDQAVLTYSLAARINPQSVPARFGVWECYRAERRYESALVVARQLTKLAPDDAHALQACTLSYRDQAQYDTATAYAQQWCEVAANDPTPCLEWSAIHQRQRDWSAMQANLEEALRRDADHLPTLLAVSQLLTTCPDRRFRDATVASRHARRACELTQWRSPATLTTLAAAYRAAGQDDFAHQVTQRCLALTPNDSPRPMFAAEPDIDGAIVR